MKSLFVMIAVLFATSALAQKHMIEFNADSILGNVSFDLSKDRGDSNAEETKTVSLLLNYAHTVTDQVQLGARGFYGASEGEGDKLCAKELSLGAIFNFDKDLQNSVFVSAYAGMRWTRFEDSDSERKSEYLLSSFAVGKRFNLGQFKLANLTYSPELAFSSVNSKQSSTVTDWSQELSFKFLQFSVLF